ncbi:dihydrofolate reductase family protein [Aldersonia kunmingensis]|uniref:dihydrofolate reductase family protein n=1 Tax=Aldersonia kunmingensis TaxID=408066 RepID=UPI00082E279E|nr:dihydrofolate reductase family protein [Aldersonia kunmingensis]
MRKLVYYIATSIDGFIADPEGDASHFPLPPETLAAIFGRYPETCPAHLREAFGVTGEARRFDTVLMGWRTHEPAVAAGLDGGGYPHLRQVVVTHRNIATTESLEVMTGDVAAQVADLKREAGRDIWLCGGADLAAQLIDVIDEIQVKIYPVLLGRGISLFGGTTSLRQLDCTDIETLPGGVALATYRTGNR